MNTNSKTLKGLFLGFVVAVCLMLSAVSAQAATPKLSKKSLTLITTSKYTLKVKGGKAKSWKSSKPKVAKVDKNGKITAKKPGTAIISAKVGKKTLKCTVKVIDGSLFMEDMKYLELDTRLDVAFWKYGKYNPETDSNLVETKYLKKVKASNKNVKITKTEGYPGCFSITPVKKGSVTLTFKVKDSTFKYKLKVVEPSDDEYMF